MITVAIVEDDADVRESLQAFLNTQVNFSCPCATESVEALLPRLDEEVLPDIILMDIGLPGMSGISGIRKVKAKHPDIDIVMLTIYADSHRIFDALCAGASGYMLKNTSFPQLKSSLEMLTKGGAPMSPQIARKVIRYFQTEKAARKSSPLSPKEAEVANWLVDGLSYKMVADQMGVSVETIRTHIKNIYKKLHVHSKGELISKSLRGEI